ncbi:11-cis-retinol dehydrogenase [Fistulifera solaris]|uniref:11-cis-retinol dehydrogenase n=1 Tax=Fistulifera solaris TaxID=1519565 RepID=A0A1Z5KRB5_FISSO|nr:11-cis-retinol dehydrogenase [Fistulifera solaris]|eukprot:GAX28863.1 11-cis-retinol dehydrogenase [Fistulifera solaris]
METNSSLVSHKTTTQRYCTACSGHYGLRSRHRRLLAEQLATSTDFVVVALALTSKTVTELRALLAKQHLVLQCNVTNETEVTQMAWAVEELLSREPNTFLFAIVNNAGMADPGDFLFDPSLKTYRTVMDVNFFGMLRVTQALLPMMLRTTKHGARILNMSSVCGAVASPGNSSYNASKFAVEAWSDALRTELAPFHIVVTKVRPGQNRTQIQVDWQTNYVKNFDAAPANVQELYGGETFRNKVLRIFQDGEKQSSAIIGEPSMVVETLRGILTLPSHKIQPYYWVGSDANTLWRALSLLPVVVADTVKRNVLHFSPVEESAMQKKLD